MRQPRALPERSMADLERIICEAKAAGWTQEEFAGLCRRLYGKETEE